MRPSGLQAQDRCHRIGQTREVHIYRLVSEKTIEENILTKSDQKRHLDQLAIQSGGFNTDFLHKFNPSDLLRGVQGLPLPCRRAVKPRASPFSCILAAGSGRKGSGPKAWDTPAEIEPRLAACLSGTPSLLVAARAQVFWSVQERRP